MTLKLHEVEVETTGGVGQGFTEEIVGGQIVAVLMYSDPSEFDPMNTKVEIITEHGRIPILDVTGTVFNYQIMAEATDASGEPLSNYGVYTFVDIPVAGERIEINVSDAGSGTKTGTFIIYTMEDVYLDEEF